MGNWGKKNRKTEFTQKVLGSCRANTKSLAAKYSILTSLEIECFIVVHFKSFDCGRVQAPIPNLGVHQFLEHVHPEICVGFVEAAILSIEI